MPEEIKNEIATEAVKITADAVAAAPKKIHAGKAAGFVGLVVGAVALICWGVKKLTPKQDSQESVAVEGEVVDNVKIAERDCLEKTEDETEE